MQCRRPWPVKSRSRFCGWAQPRVLGAAPEQPRVLHQILGLDGAPRFLQTLALHQDHLPCIEILPLKLCRPKDQHFLETIPHPIFPGTRRIPHREKMFSFGRWPNLFVLQILLFFCSLHSESISNICKVMRSIWSSWDIFPGHWPLEHFLRAIHSTGLQQFEWTLMRQTWVMHKHINVIPISFFGPCQKTFDCGGHFACGQIFTLKCFQIVPSGTFCSQPSLYMFGLMWQSFTPACKISLYIWHSRWCRFDLWQISVNYVACTCTHDWSGLGIAVL